MYCALLLLCHARPALIKECHRVALAKSATLTRRNRVFRNVGCALPNVDYVAAIETAQRLRRLRAASSFVRPGHGKP